MKHTKNPTLYNNDASALGTLVLVFTVLWVVPANFLLLSLKAIGDWADGPGFDALNKLARPASRIISGSRD